MESRNVTWPAQGVFCALLVKARKTAGLTQQNVARRLKKPQSFVAKYERGERRLDVVEFVAITRAIGADPVHILRALLKSRLSRGLAAIADERCPTSLALCFLLRCHDVGHLSVRLKRHRASRKTPGRPYGQKTETAANAENTVSYPPSG
jgi:transcriptional regulator with XRE-family HTH domain